MLDVFLGPSAAEAVIDDVLRGVDCVGRRETMRMMRKTSFDGLDAAPRWIVMFLGAYLMVDLFVLYIWNASGQVFSLQGTSGQQLCAVGDRHGRSGLVVVPLVLRSFPAGAPLRSAWMLITLVGGGTNRVRCSCAIPGNRLAVESAGMERPCEVRFDRANLADCLRWPVDRSGWYCWPQPCGGATHVPENRLPGAAQRHRLGDVRYLLPVHALPVQ